MTVTGREGNTVHLATEYTVMGRTRKGTEKHVLMPLAEERIERDGEGATSRVHLEV